MLRAILNVLNRYYFALTEKVNIPFHELLDDNVVADDVFTILVQLFKARIIVLL